MIGAILTMKKYYFDEHEIMYQRMKTENISAWDEYYDPIKYSFDNFMMRPFLEKALNMTNLNGLEHQAFEYGCGTGAGAGFLAKRGFVVDAVDISPTAIEMANKIADIKGLEINFKVQDLIELPALQNKYDVILDNYCLQSIVTDDDRKKLFSIVLSGLKDSGYYIVSSAIYNENRIYTDDCYFCPDTGIAYDKIQNAEIYDGAVKINDEWWLPNRRHLSKEELREEVCNAGFDVIFQENGNLICKKA